LNKYKEKISCLFYQIKKKFFENYNLILFGESDEISKKLLGDINYYHIKDIKYNSYKNINFFFLIKIFFSLKSLKALIKDGIFVSYLVSVISFYKPKLFLTFIDNNIKFYYLKKYFNTVKFVAIQNGARHKLYDLFGHPDIKKKNLSCDAIFVFGGDIKKMYKRYISANFYTVGCYRNNLFKIQKIKKKRTIVFISQFRNHDENSYINHFGEKVITWRQFNKIIYEVLPIILDFSFKNNLKLLILGCYKPWQIEYDYYKKILNKTSHWQFIKAESYKKSYFTIDSSELVVNIWSTLGYESLSRSNKTCFLRSKNFGSFDDRNFGWPGKYNERGRFFTNEINKKKIYSILNYLKNVSNNDWLIQCNKYKKDIMKYEYGNDRIINFIKSSLK
jgi:surface carbohydrate biosynthesis protein